ncbi:RICIN domain-containing protein [Chitinophaga sp. 22321]|uniref:RICIN domain-containing protein n=1 Tax=Chitinophaga hostae TaxID=2831022 RepID=A0ABS5IYX0_9BACT|nr:RICIN domain-containing protein [Chitinophaga hostae]MBS0028160.1 RICIN domain-containing protein [Chitinophaga hostae]
MKITLPTQITIATTTAVLCIWLLSCKREQALERILEKKVAASLMALIGTTYYIDLNGDDNNSGKSPDAAWKSLEKINAATFSPGDHILFKSGDSWTGSLQPKGSGTSGAPIVIDKYGGDAKPVINGGGPANNFSTVLLKDVSYWEINNLEVTNRTPQGSTYRLTGIRLQCPRSPAKPYTNISIKNCYIHDVNSAIVGQPNYEKFHGGIITDGRFDTLLIQNCLISNCSMEGIHTQSDENFALRSKNIIIDNNRIENIEGDGIVIAEVGGGCRATNNVVNNACKNTNANFAGLWTYFSYQTVISHNEVYGMTGGGPNDGMAWDADTGSDGDIIEYNYSHDNNGGFLLLMPGVANITVRYNVSVNDVGTTGHKKLILMGGGVTNNHIYNNVFYLKNPVNKIFLNNPSGVTISNNIFLAAPTATVKTLVGDDGSNPVAPNANVTFLNNCFYPSAKFSSLNWGTSVQNNNFYADPQFINPVWGTSFDSTDGFKTGATSPCRSTGIFINNNGGKDFWNNPLPAGTPDVGAFQQESTMQITDGAIYTFISAVNNISVIDVTGASTTDGTPLILWGGNNGNNQKWLARYAGNGYYIFKSMLDTMKVMDVRAAGTTDGTPLQLYYNNNTNAQKWLVIYEGGYIRFKSALIDKSIDVISTSATDGTQIQLWGNNSGHTQQFRLVKQ